MELKAVLQIRLSEKTKQEFKETAIRRGVNQSDLVREWIEEYVRKNKN